VAISEFVRFEFIEPIDTYKPLVTQISNDPSNCFDLNMKVV